MPALLEEVKLRLLRRFLKAIQTSVAEECQRIHSKHESGEFEEYEDLESAFDGPLFQLEFGAESILHLLNAHIEKQLFAIARSGGKISKREFFESPKYPVLKERVEQILGGRLEEIADWAEYSEMRKRVNVLKHGSGVHKPEDAALATNKVGMLRRYSPNFDDADNYIDICLKLTQELWARAAKNGIDS